ncbi:MAG: response regulator [Gammaproteobacteria bacterium]|nr:response regulator [Gammaproteobacteria bacterium]MDH3411087.1 response regulator [Gammaproteobacteria bacterium]
MTRVLIVDDEPHVLLVIRLGLERAGYEVASARNGQVALELIRKSPPDMLITDMNMPVMDGRALCEKVREELKLEFPILVISTIAEVEKRSWVPPISNTEFFEKPISLRQLVARLEKQFGRSSATVGNGNG